MIDALESIGFVLIKIVAIIIVSLIIIIIMRTMMTITIMKIEHVYTLARQMSQAYHTYCVVLFVRQVTHATSDLSVRQRANRMTDTFNCNVLMKISTYRLHTRCVHSCCRKQCTCHYDTTPQNVHNELQVSLFVY